jgi:hypothetical protein
MRVEEDKEINRPIAPAFAIIATVPVAATIASVISSCAARTGHSLVADGTGGFGFGFDLALGSADPEPSTWADLPLIRSPKTGPREAGKF